MKVLITGGAGFIGSHLADACIESGDAVAVLDDFSTGSLENVAHLLGHPRFRCIEGSILDRQAVEPLIEWSDAVYHVAAVVGMNHVVEHPVLTFKTNVEGSAVVFDTAAAYGRRVLFTSTSEIYGLNQCYPTPESASCVLGSTLRNRWSYAFSKASAEVLAAGYYNEQGTEIIITRLFNTVGPRQSGRYGMVIPRFVRQALSGKPLTVYGDGSQTRSFGDVREIVQALIKLMKHPGSPGQMINVGNPREVSIIDLAHRVIAMTGSSSRIEFVSYDIAYEPGFEDIMRRVPDVTTVRKLIDFCPQSQIDSILADVIAEQRQRLVAV